MLQQLRFYSTTHSQIWKEASLIAKYASKPVVPITLNSLLSIGTDHHTTIAKYVHKELPVRLARRIVAIQVFILMTAKQDLDLDIERL